MYFDGALENARIAPFIYPGWICRFYCGTDVPEAIQNELRSLGAEVVTVENTRGTWEGLYWRFYPAADHNIERFISRDTDSRLNQREKAAVDAWIMSGKPFHLMRDHKNHDVPILGGMWGCTGGLLANLDDMLNKWGDFNNKGCDQKFLTAHVWPTVKDIQIGHASWHQSRFGGNPAVPFPKHDKMNYGSFVGEIIK